MDRNESLFYRKKNCGDDPNCVHELSCKGLKLMSFPACWTSRKCSLELVELFSTRKVGLSCLLVIVTLDITDDRYWQSILV